MACSNASKFFPVLKAPALAPGTMKGKLALITGGGTGLGKAMATTFSMLGADVVIASRRMEVLKATASEISRHSGIPVTPVQLDVRNAESVRSTYDAIESQFGRLPNVVVNNAAGNFVMATQRLSANAIKTIVEIVLLGTLNVTTELGRRLIDHPDKNQGCSFLNITTPYARSGSPFVVPSGVSKAGVENMVKSLASEWSRYGMRFNVIAPGPVLTEGATGRLSGRSMEDAAAAVVKQIPVGRSGEPEEIANLAAFICSDFGSWLNGSIIDMDGGQQFFMHGSHVGGGEGFKMTNEDWKNVENIIRGRTGKETKAKL